MAFTQIYIMPQRWKQFDFYETQGLRSTISAQFELQLSSIYKLGEIRLHFSTAVPSTFDMVVTVSAAKGSLFNTKLFSTALSGVQDLFVHYSDPLFFESDDQVSLHFNASVSTAGNIGMQCIGWAVTG